MMETVTNLTIVALLLTLFGAPTFVIGVLTKNSCYKDLGKLLFVYSAIALSTAFLLVVLVDLLK